ncbi:MAG: STAS domain-containing protein [Candidatus Micrarchaeaceae archaeon]
MAADPVVPFPSLTFEQQKSGDTVTLVCHGRVVFDSIPALQDKVRTAIAQAQAQTIVLDLSDVRYMDSSGLGALVGLYVSAKRNGKHLKLINLSDRVLELLRLTKLITVFEGYGEYL